MRSTFRKTLSVAILSASTVGFTTSCWVSIPAYYRDFGLSCYPGSSLKNNPYGELIREQFDLSKSWWPMMSGEGLRTAAALVELGVPVNEPVENGSTPLMWASWAGFANLVELFLDAGADVNAKAADGVTPLFCSTFDPSGTGAMMEEVALAAGLEVDTAVPLGARGTTALLLAAGAEVDPATRNGTTPLMIASRRLSFGVVLALLDSGAEPNRQDDQGMTALMFVAAAPPSDAQKHVAALLLEKGADISLRNRDGKTAVTLARDYQNEGLVRLLEQVAVTR